MNITSKEARMIRSLPDEEDEMKFTIRNRHDNSVMFEVEADSLKEAVEKKVAERADLGNADLGGAKNLVKIMGVEPGNTYWKRFDSGLKNNGYQFYVGLNTLREGEVFAADDRVTCSYPGFHFASRSWCAVYYPGRPLEARIRIPDDAQINEPWATDGKASASAIEILQVFETATGKDITDQFRRPEEKKAKKTRKVKS